MVSSSVGTVNYSDCSGNLKSVFDFPSSVWVTASHGTYFYSLCFYKGQHCTMVQFGGSCDHTIFQGFYRYRLNVLLAQEKMKLLPNCVLKI